MLYHGSQYRFSQFKSPDQTGNFRLSEKHRSHHCDCVFLTSNLLEALAYAGKEGYLYLVSAPDAEIYNQSGKKKPIIRESVFVAVPNNIIINLRLKLAPRKRNQVQEFFVN